MVRISNDDIEYPSNMGQKWTDEEELLLLTELNNNETVEQIAQKHGRTVRGIHLRCLEIAYKMHLKKVPLFEIMKQTKVEFDSIQQTIQKKQSKKTISKETKTKELDNVFISINKRDYMELQTEMNNLKKDINQMNHTLTELVGMITAIYEFEK